MIRTMVFAAVVAVCGCDLETAVETPVEQSVLSPNPCTAVALLTPVSGFAGVVGAQIALSASATCPTGQTAEFSYWHKKVGDANWAVDAYVPGGSTFTPPTAGDWCLSVAARAVGATESFQTRSGSTCGTVTDTSTTPATTIVVPVVPPTADSPHNALYAMVSGIGSSSHPLVVSLPLTVGKTIRALRVRVLDGGTGTKVQASLLIARDNAQAFSTVFTSPPSLGLGVEETIGVTSAAIPVDPATQYFVTVFTSAGALVSNVYRLEVDVN